MPSTRSVEADAVVRAPHGEVRVVATVQGLVAEADRVREAFRACAPKAVALGVSPEAAAALLRYEIDHENDPFEDLPEHDYAYSIRLREYGDVALPPPDLQEAVHLAREAGVSVYGVDLPDETYEEMFTKEVSALALLRYGRIQRRLVKRPPKADDARGFTLAWDAAIRKVRGLDRLERAREERIAEQALALNGKVQGAVLLVVDLPRASGVLACLRASEAPG